MGGEEEGGTVDEEDEDEEGEGRVGRGDFTEFRGRPEMLRRVGEEEGIGGGELGGGW